MTSTREFQRLAEQRSLALDYIETLTPDEIPSPVRQRLLAILDDGRATGPACGKTQATDGTTWPPCARPAGHTEAYCRDESRSRYFLARA
ncbi:hypothetical protein [Streptomyces sp. NPDC101249]|uniref:hypothetical protein n=1 Tax=Streptomyces sp. NPDC101249 TaxID=3366140 RepID=UPI00382E8225